MQISWFWFSFPPLILAFIKDLTCRYYCAVPMVILFSISFIHLHLFFIHWKISVRSMYPPSLIYFLTSTLVPALDGLMHFILVSEQQSSTLEAPAEPHPNTVLGLSPQQIQVWLVINVPIFKGGTFRRSLGHKGSSVSVDKALEKAVLCTVMSTPCRHLRTQHSSALKKKVIHCHLGSRDQSSLDI